MHKATLMSNISKDIIIGTAQTQGAVVLNDPMPSEILIEIFKMIRDNSKPNEDAWQKLRDPNLVSMNWIKQVSSVCWHWRDILRSIPDFWCDVHLTKGLKLFKLSLERSKDMNVDVFVHDAMVLESALPELSTLAGRIKKLFVLDLDDTTVNALEKLFRAGMPALSDLRIDAENLRYESYITLGDEMIGPERLPALHTLYLNAAYVDWQSSFVSNLRVLRLEHWMAGPDWEPLELNVFLDMLRKCEALEELWLEGPLPFSTFGAGNQQMSLCSLVSLPNLRSAYFLVDPDEAPDSPDIFHLLSYLIFPASARVMVHSHVQDMYGEDEVVPEFGRGGVLHTIPQDATVLPILREATSVVLRRRGFDCYLHAGCNLSGDDANLGVLLEAIGRSIDTWRYTVAKQLEETFTLLKHAPLREMDIESIEAPAASWLQVFEQFPALASIKVEDIQAPNERGRGPPALGQVLHALSHASAPLPELRALKIISAPWSVEILHSVTECLRARAKQGLKLSELQLYSRDRELAGKHAKLLHDLESLVDGPVTYIEGPFPQ